MAAKMLILTDADRQLIERHVRKLAQLQRELTELEKSGVMDCKDYRELCEYVQQSLTAKYNHFWPRGAMKRVAKSED